MSADNQKCIFQIQMWAVYNKGSSREEGEMQQDNSNDMGVFFWEMKM